MEIKIGGKTLKTKKPGDLDAVLIAWTGCSAAETATQLASWPSPGRLASALHPFLADDAPSVPELAAMISEDQDVEIIGAVQKLYAVEASPSSAAPAKGTTSTAKADE